jgi:hypothetical protein
MDPRPMQVENYDWTQIKPWFRSARQNTIRTFEKTGPVREDLINKKSLLKTFKEEILLKICRKDKLTKSFLEEAEDNI